MSSSRKCGNIPACLKAGKCLRTLGSVAMGICMDVREGEYCVHCDTFHPRILPCQAAVQALFNDFASRAAQPGESLRVRLPKDFQIRDRMIVGTETRRLSSSDNPWKEIQRRYYDKYSDQYDAVFNPPKEPPMTITKSELARITAQAKGEVDDSRLAEAKSLIKGKLIQIERAKAVVRNLELELAALKDQLVVAG